MDHQQDASPHVSHGVPPGGDPVDILLAGDMWQEGLVENVGPGKADIADDEEDRGPDIGAVPQECEESCAHNSQAGEEAEIVFLAPRVIGHRPQDRPEEGDDQQGDGGCICPVGGGVVGTGPGGQGQLPVEDGKDCGHDGGGKGRIAPVVHGPGVDDLAIGPVIQDGTLG